MTIFCGVSFAQERRNIDLLDQWFSDTVITNSSQARFSGCWGFVHNKKEFAVIGSTEGSHFFQLTDQNKLKPVGFIKGRFSSSQVVHRETKTYKNYAYAVCDEGTSSLQIIDLNYLPDSVVLVADIQNEFFGKIHNLFIDTSNALLYACRVTPFISGIPGSLIPMRVFSLADPINPVLIWEGPSDIPEVHDCYVRNNIAILNCGMDGLRIYDFSNPTAPIYKSNLNFYQDQGFNHQGWLSPDGTTYVFADETNGKRVKKCTIQPDLSISVTHLFGTNYTNGSVPHNIMCTNEFAFVAYYNEGLRIFSIKSTPEEVAFYDTYPQTSSFKMNGAWGVYANYPSERIIVSDRQNGLFLLWFDRELFSTTADDDFKIYPNPLQVGEELIVRSPNDQINNFQLEIFDVLGRKIANYHSGDNSYIKLKVADESGTYFLSINYQNYLNEQIKKTFKVIISN